jgi:glutathione S-transferase
MITFYDNPFSPFTRKVRLALAHKGLPFESVDGLALKELPALKAVNPRGEVPALVDGEITVVNSADIVDYLDHRYPQPSLRPDDPAMRVKARQWERLADSVFDAIFHDISLWRWPTHRRTDSPPAGLMDAAKKDLTRILERMEGDLAGQDYVCGAYSIADMALWPHVSSLKPLGLFPPPEQFPGVIGWIRRMREKLAVKADIDTAQQAVERILQGNSPYEGKKIIWRGDRIEWLFSHGFHDWLMAEIREGRAVIPVSL